MPVANRRGGAEATLLQLLASDETSVQWHVVFLEDGPMVSEARALGAETSVVVAGRLRQPHRLVHALFGLRSIMRTWKPDIVVSWMTKAQLYAALPAVAQRVPTVWFQHGLPSARDPLERLIAALPTRGVIAPSNTVANAQRALWPHRRTFVAYPSGAESGSSNVTLSEHGIPAGAPVVGIVSRLQAWKGIHVLVAAFAEVLGQHPDAQLVVVGGDHPLEPGYRAKLDDLARSLGISSSVHLVGYQADGPAWMGAFDVVVHASHNEPFGLVVLEAMRAGKPLVAGALGGPSEIIRDGENGFLVPYGDEAGIADRVSRLLSDPELAARMGAAASARAEEFTARQFAHAVMTAIQSSTQNS